LVESLSVMYKATKDPKLLEVAFKQVDRLRRWCKTTCGYANVQNVYSVDIEDKVQKKKKKKNFFLNFLFLFLNFFFI